jgi:predicted neuraminidase
MATIRAYLEDVYPMGSLGPGGSATDAEASGLFRSRHWYYAGAPGLVQPSIVRTAPGVLTAFFRDRAAKHVYGATSRDEGASWSVPTPAQAGGLPNNNAGIEAFQLLSGRTLLLFNNVSGSGGVRTPMTAATSPDGGLSWTVSRNLQVHDDNDTKAVEFSYPSVLQTPDGTIHAAYTYNRQTIKYVRFTEGWLR